MKLIIAGGRSYRLTKEDVAKLDAIHVETPVSEVISGGCRGVDQDAERWALTRKIPIVVMAAAWAEHGKKAGPIRNREMAARADAVTLFSGGRGTASMRAEAVRAGIAVYDFRGT